MALDLVAEVRVALVAAGLDGEQLDARIERAVERVLARRDGDRLLDSRAAAAYLGLPNAKALRARVERGGPLRELRLEIDGAARWRKSDLDALIATGQVKR